MNDSLKCSTEVLQVKTVSLFVLSVVCAATGSAFARDPANPSDLQALSVNRLMQAGIDLGEDSACSTTRSDDFPTGDIFEKATRILPRPNHPHPEHDQECIDLHEFRPALTLLPEEKQAWNLPNSAGHMAIANVRGISQFYVASIPLDSLEWLHFNVYEARPVGGHAEVVAHFSQPVILRPQFPAQNTQTRTTFELVLSLQGISSANADFTLASFDGSFLSAITVSLPEFKLNRINKEKSIVSTYALNLSQPDSIAFVRAFLETANTSRLRTVYNLFGDRNWFYDDTLFNLNVNGQVVDLFGDVGGNCTTVHLMILDRVLGERYSSVQRGLIRKEFLSYFDPAHVLAALQHRGVLTSADENYLGTWIEEPTNAEIMEQIRNGEI